jgi:ABC-type antimicrobial peptide transport system permease subunit
VFSEVLLENGLIGLTGGVFGMALVLVLAPIVNGSLFSSLAQFDTLVAVPWAVGIMLAAIAICLLVAAGVSWNATRVRPLEVLRYE